jgi:hypothetical protein
MIAIVIANWPLRQSLIAIVDCENYRNRIAIGLRWNQRLRSMIAATAKWQKEST